MQVVLLVAGVGSRMGELTKNTHKSLLALSPTESFLTRLLHQANEYPISKLVVVTGYHSDDIEAALANFQLNIEVVRNDRYKDDVNIYSMHLALQKLSSSEPVIIIEGDTYIDDQAFRRIFTRSKAGDSVYFTRGDFLPHQYGGIIHADAEAQIDDVQIVPKYELKYQGYKKMLGIMSVGPNELDAFKSLINEQVQITLQNYYLMPWIQHLDQLPCKFYDLLGTKITSVNTAEEYEVFYKELNDGKQKNIEVVLLDIDTLLPIEAHIPNRVPIVERDILALNIWNKPIVVEKNNNLILDGHHRYEVAKRLGLKRIPAVLVDYHQIDVWSLRDDEFVDVETVIARAKAGNIFPNKTVKHNFGIEIPEISIEIDELGV